jgi:hypothetical protein
MDEEVVGRYCGCKYVNKLKIFSKETVEKEIIKKIFFEKIFTNKICSTNRTIEIHC